MPGQLPKIRFPKTWIETRVLVLTTIRKLQKWDISIVQLFVETDFRYLPLCELFFNFFDFFLKSILGSCPGNSKFRFVPSCPSIARATAQKMKQEKFYISLKKLVLKLFSSFFRPDLSTFAYFC